MTKAYGVNISFSSFNRMLPDIEHYVHATQLTEDITIVAEELFTRKCVTCNIIMLVGYKKMDIK